MTRGGKRLLPKRRNARPQEKVGVELKAAGAKVAGRKETRKPHIDRIETDMGKMAVCQDQYPAAHAQSEH